MGEMFSGRFLSEVNRGVAWERYEVRSGCRPEFVPIWAPRTCIGREVVALALMIERVSSSSGERGTSLTNSLSRSMVERGVGRRSVRLGRIDVMNPLALGEPMGRQ